MTDTEIIRTLEHCSEDENCKYCPMAHSPYCMSEVMKNALDLIKRQQEQIKALIAGQEALQEHIIEERERIVEKLEKCSVTYCKEYGYKEDEGVLYLPDAIEIVKGGAE